MPKKEKIYLNTFLYVCFLLIFCIPYQSIPLTTQLIMPASTHETNDTQPAPTHEPNGVSNVSSNPTSPPTTSTTSPAPTDHSNIEPTEELTDHNSLTCDCCYVACLPTALVICRPRIFLASSASAIRNHHPIQFRIRCCSRGLPMLRS